MSRRVGGYDSALWGSVIGIIAISVYLLMTSIVDSSGEIYRDYGVKQLVMAAVALFIAGCVARIDVAVFEQYWKNLYVICISMIAIVFLIGSAIRGSRRWIPLGIINLQPSEFGKIIVVLAVGGYLAHNIRYIQTKRVVTITMLLVGLPALLVFAQPDFGTAQIYGFIFLALIFFGGSKWKHFATIVGTLAVISILVLGVLPSVGVYILKEYQVDRLTGFMNPENDPQGISYHANQAKVAIGSGQFTGRDDASQVGRGFLPEAHTDFVFANLVEQQGFLGGAVVLMLFAVMLSRCLRGVATAPTVYGRLVCGGVSAMIGSQVLINVGMNLGIMPITGVPLPFLSYGGSAMVANLMAVAIVSSILRSSESAPVRYARRMGPYGGSPSRRRPLRASRNRRPRVPLS